MMRKPLSTGKTDRDPLAAFDLLSAARMAHDRHEKLWFRLRGDSSHLYEIWPGGRNVAWPLALLKRRRERQEPLAAEYKCKHVWETHTDSEPTAAGMHVESFRQCFKCGEIR